MVLTMAFRIKGQEIIHCHQDNYSAITKVRYVIARTFGS